MAETSSGWKTLAYASSGAQYGGSQINVKLEAYRQSTTSATIIVKVYAQTQPVSTTWWQDSKPSISVSGSVSGSATLGTSSDTSWHTVVDTTVSNQNATTITVNWSASHSGLGGTIQSGSASGTLSISIAAGYYTDTFYLFGTSVGTKTHVQGGSIVLLGAQTSTGYTFGGWKAAWNSTVYAAGATVTMPNADSRFDAMMNPNPYTVSFNANGGQGTVPAAITVKYKESATLPSTTLSRVGYDLKGWSDSSTATSAKWSLGGSYTQDVASNRTLYAVWERYMYVPDPPTNVKLSNVIAGSRVDNTKAALTWNAVASTRGKDRTGWKIYDAATGKLLADMKDSSAGAKSITLDVNIESKTLTVKLVAYNALEQSTVITSNMIYGRLASPTKTEALRKGNYARIEVIDDDVPSYPYEFGISYSYDQENWVTEETHLVEFIGANYKNETIYVRAFKVPATSLGLDPVLYGSPDFLAEILPGPNTPPDTAAAVQDIIPHDDGPHCIVTWNPVMKDGKEDADYYVVKTVTPQGETKEIAKVDAVGTDNPDYLYKVDFLWMGAASVKVIVIAVKNGWESEPVELEYKYNPQYLKPPVITAIEHVSGFYYDVLFEPATGGIQYDAGSKEAGYMYTLYVNNVQATYQSPTNEVIISSEDESQHRIRMRVYSPRQVFVRLAATDERKRSVLSNTMGISHQSPGVGMLVHGCKSLTIESCVIENLATAAIAAYEGTKVEVSNTLLKVVGDESKHYDIEEDSTVVELNCEYE